MQDQSREWLNQYLYYLIVAVVSVVMLVFMPAIGSVAGIEWILPTTTAGWVVYVISKLSSAGFNVMIFHCFNKQGKLNIIDHESYQKASKMLYTAKKARTKAPRSPEAFKREIYGKKGLTIFITTILGTIGLSQAVLTFNTSEFIVQLISLIMALVFGVFQMKSTEEYWTVEFMEFAIYITEKERKECLHLTEKNTEI